MTTETIAADLVQDEVEKDAGDRVLAAICIASFLAALNFLATTPFYPQMADDLGTTVPLLGQAITLMILASAALGMAVGPLADRYGYRWPLTIGVLCVAVTLIGTGLAPSYPFLLGLSITGGLADALVFGLPLAAAGHLYSGAAQRRAMGFAIGALSIAPIIGVPLLTTIGDLTNWRVAVVCAGLLAAATAGLVATSLPPDKQQRADRFRWREMLAAYKPLLRHTPTLRLYGVTALRAATFIGLLTYLGAFLADELGIGTRTIGFIYTAGGIGSAIASLLGGRIHFRSPRLVVGVLVVLNGLAAGIVLLSSSLWTVVPSLMILTGTSALAGVVLATLFVRESPAGTATTMVLNGTTLNLGSAVGAALGGALIALGGYTALGIGLPFFAFAAAALAWWPAAGERVRG